MVLINLHAARKQGKLWWSRRKLSGLISNTISGSAWWSGLISNTISGSAWWVGARRHLLIKSIIPRQRPPRMPPCKTAYLTSFKVGQMRMCRTFASLYIPFNEIYTQAGNKILKANIFPQFRLAAHSLTVHFLSSWCP